MPPRGPKRRRFEQQGHARYFTFSCFRRLPLFDDDEFKTFFVRALDAARSRHGFRLWAWVVMPEHAHVLLWPGETTASPILQSIKQPVATRALRAMRDRNAPILARLRDGAGRTKFWLPGGGYDRNIFSPKELRKKVNYTNENPARRGLVERASDWRWSSAAWYAGAGDTLLTMDPLPAL